VTWNAAHLLRRTRNVGGGKRFIDEEPSSPSVQLRLRAQAATDLGTPMVKSIGLHVGRRVFSAPGLTSGLTASGWMGLQ